MWGGGGITRVCYLLPDDAGVRLEFYNLFLYTNHCKTCLRSFRPVPIQTALKDHRRWHEACSFVFRKKGDCTVALITNSRLSLDTAQSMAKSAVDRFLLISMPY